MIFTKPSHANALIAVFARPQRRPLPTPMIAVAHFSLIRPLLASPRLPALLSRLNLGRHKVRVRIKGHIVIRGIFGLGYDLLTRYLDRDAEAPRDSVYAVPVQGAPHRRDQRFQFTRFHLGEGTVTPIAQCGKLAQTRITVGIEEDVVVGSYLRACYLHITHIEQVVYAHLQGQRDRFEYLDVGALHAAVSRERGEDLIINGQTVPHGNVVTQVLQAQPSRLKHATHPLIDRYGHHS